MTRYAIVVNDIVDNIAVADEPLAANWVESDTAGIGWLLVDGELTPPLATVATTPPRVVITGLAINGTQMITPRPRVVLRQGQSLGVTVQIQKEGQLLPITDSFAVPIGRVGGAVEQTERAEFTGGTANMLIPFNSSGEFEVTQALLNLYLPPEQQMLFDTFNISVTRT